MKRLLYAATLTLVLTSNVPAVRADDSPREYQKTTLLVHSGAHPNNARVPNATHHFKLYVAGNALSQLSIDLPEGISVRRGIEVTDQSGKKVDETVSINDRKATIAFAQPVPPGTLLSVEMKGIRTSDYLGRTWLYRVYGKDVGMTGEIPLGTARIQTYK
ncbi:MAG TPA: DUF2808 domain-containing protein [Allocoleopsis sp.]